MINAKYLISFIRFIVLKFELLIKLIVQPADQTVKDKKISYLLPATKGYLFPETCIFFHDQILDDSELIKNLLLNPVLSILYRFSIARIMISLTYILLSYLLDL